MNVTYDNYYQTRNYFGEPYPELINFLAEYPKKGKLLDLGCGQGRDAIALARIGYTVTGVDISKVGIDQMNSIAKAENLNLTGRVADIYVFDDYEKFDFILLDSMFHFTERDKEKEIGLVQKIISSIKKKCLAIICIQDTGNKIQTLNDAIECMNNQVRLVDKKFKFIFEDVAGGHKSETDYRMIVIKKL